MKNLYSYLAVSFAIVCMTTFFSDISLAQTRYLDAVFNSVSVTTNVVYGNNLTVLSGSPLASDLKMDVYEPAGDSITNRPVIIVLHTGNFLPTVFNGAPTGTKEDNAVVEMCTQLAKRGYVTAAVAYRRGWNPLSIDVDVRTGTIINAAYRGVQDAHTAVRFFRMDATLNGNTFGVDTSKVVVGGIGTGGYVSYGFASFDDYAELGMAKFLDFSQSPPVPYIDTALSGDFNAEWVRPMNTPNHIGYNNAANMVFALGGAMGDSTWMKVGDVPMISFHNINDPNAPYHYGAVIVPTTGDFVLDASGGHSVIWNANNMGNNDAFATETYTDCYSVYANLINDGRKGLYPFKTPPPGSNTCSDGATENEQGSPWDWWDQATYISNANAVGKDGPLENCHALLSNPDMSETRGKLYMDTVVGYLLPRMYKVLFGTFVDGFCYVAPDVLAPSISSLTVTSDSTLDITYSEVVDQSSAETLVNYSADQGLNTPESAMRDASDSTIVHIEFANQFQDGVTNTLTVTNVSDNSGNVIGSISDTFEYVFISIKEGSINPADFTIYPNPSSGAMNISSKELIRSIDIYDISGRVIHTRSSINSKEFVLNIEEVRGMYFARITTDYGQVTTKIIFN